MTDPPLIANIALPVARRFGAPLDRGHAGRVSRDRRRAQAARAAAPRRAAAEDDRFSLGRADRVVAIGETMRRRLEEKGVAAGADRRDPELGGHRCRPAEASQERMGDRARSCRAVRRHALGERRSGPGSRHAHPRDDAAARPRRPLCGRHRVRRPARGASGACRPPVAADAVTFPPFQPADVVSSSLSSADVHFVGLAHGLAGYVVPSRVYGIMAAGEGGDRLGRSGERDGAARRRGRLRDRHPARPARSGRAARSASCARRATTSSAWAASASSSSQGEAAHEIAFRRYRKLIGEMAASR